MSGRPHLNGSDFLMLGFDHESRRRGFAGNSCHILLELDGRLDPPVFQKRVDEVHERYPLLRSRVAGVLLPFWKATSAKVPKVVVHEDSPGLLHRLTNESIDSQHGELTRFQLIRGADGNNRVLFTWAHTLMDAISAEHFLGSLGRTDRELPSGGTSKTQASDKSFVERFKLSRKNIHQIDRFSKAPPRNFAERYSGEPCEMHHRVERFNVEETRLVRTNIAKHAGALSAVQYHACATVRELDRLYGTLGEERASFVLPIPVGLRPKGTVEPLFSNHVTMLMTQVLPEHLESIAGVVATLKEQASTAMREGLVEGGRVLADIFRFLPVPVFMAILKQGLKGEICSLFYGDTGAVDPLLDTFLGVRIADFTHIAAVTPSPGIGTVFYYFRDELRVTVIWSAKRLSEAEAEEFALGIRKRLLEP